MQVDTRRLTWGEPADEMTIQNDITRRWASAAQPGATEKALSEFERRYSVQLPEDFRDYLRRANGTGDDMDDLGFQFWSLDRIKPVEVEIDQHKPDRDLYPGCFVFADYLLWCWAYAIQFAGDPAEIGRIFIVRVDGTRPPPIAASFTGFAEAYLADSPTIY